MKRLVLALIIGLAIGYTWGYGDGDGGRGTIVVANPRSLRNVEDPAGS